MRRRGLSLLEIVLALALVALALGAVLAVVPGAHRQAAQSRNRFLASAAAREALESVRSLPYGATVPDEVLAPRRFEMVVEGVPTSVLVRVDSLAFAPQAAGRLAADPSRPYSRVTLKVSWEEGTGAASERARRDLTVVGAVARR